MKIKLLTSIIVSLLTCISTSQAAEVVEKILAQVENQIILKSDISKLKNSLKTGILLEQGLVDLYNIKKLKSSSKERLNYLIDQKVVESACPHSNEKIKNRVESNLNKISNQAGLSIKQFKREIEKQGITFSNYKKFMENSTRVSCAFETQISPRVKVSDQDVIRELEDLGKADFKEFYSYGLKQFVIPASTENLEVVLAELKQKVNYDNFTQAKNILKKKGINVDVSYFDGNFKSGEINPELNDKLKRVEPPAVLKSFYTGGGYVFIKMMDKERSFELTKTATTEKIRAALYRAELKRVYKNWLEEKKSSFFISIN